ncbi:GDSL-like lipase/acylhydrolase superfamily protein [Actinidia rufa]|uniref:GDSL-like lipase/acylhydrolase superfamily protein n=1 Tax=Actinidia rufa TaxID=165716 RepID=A0A7J0GH93_9ERIC|nr:GDSL-like lipase/acylhydrolase superfamily protein [Actinidia rufa]
MLKVVCLQSDAAKMYEMIKCTSTEQNFGSRLIRCGLCGGTTHSFKVLASEPESVQRQNDFTESDLKEKECGAALVFFRTRYAAVIASQGLQSSNPMLWVTDLAPEPRDVYWKNLSIPYRQLWIRRITTLSGLYWFDDFVCYSCGFCPKSPSPRGNTEKISISERGFKEQGYCPCGNRVSSQCYTDVISVCCSPCNDAATFFMTYVLTSGWASLSSEIMQPYMLLCNFFNKFILRNNDDPSNGTLSFPYHTEIPRVLLFGFLGFTYSLLAPLILPFLLVYFFLANLVYRNQVLIDMDRNDEQCGRMEEIYKQLQSVYCQFASTSNAVCNTVP